MAACFEYPVKPRSPSAHLWSGKLWGCHRPPADAAERRHLDTLSPLGGGALLPRCPLALLPAGHLVGKASCREGLPSHAACLSCHGATRTKVGVCRDRLKVMPFSLISPHILQLTSFARVCNFIDLFKESALCFSVFSFIDFCSWFPSFCLFYVYFALPMLGFEVLR